MQTSTETVIARKALEVCAERLEAWADGESKAQIAAEQWQDRVAAEGHYNTRKNYLGLAETARIALIGLGAAS